MTDSLEVQIIKPEPSWVSYSIIIGGLLLFLSIFLNLFINIDWWILPLLGILIIFIPWTFIWKPKKGKLRIDSSSLKINYEDDPTIQINFSEIVKLELKFKHYKGQSEGIIGILSSTWPYYSGYENIVKVSSNTETFELGVYAKDKFELNNFVSKFKLIQSIKTKK